MAYTDKTWAANEALTASGFNAYLRDALRHLAEPDREVINITTGTNYTTTSTSFVDVNTTDYQVDLTPSIGGGQTCDILVGGMFALRCSGDATPAIIHFDLMVNGVSVSGANGIIFVEGATNQIFPVTLNYLLQGQDNSAKAIKLRWKTSDGARTATLYTQSGGTRQARSQFWARVL